MSSERDPGLSLGRRVALIATIVGAGATAGCGLFEEESPHIPGEVPVDNASCDSAAMSETESIDTRIEHILCRELWERTDSAVETYQDRDNSNITSREMREHRGGIELRYIEEPRHLYVSVIFAPDETGGRQPDLSQPQEFEVRAIVRGQNADGSFVGVEKTRITLNSQGYLFEDERLSDDGVTERVEFTGEGAAAGDLARIESRLNDPIGADG